MNSKKYVFGFMSLVALLGTLALATPALAQTTMGASGSTSAWVAHPRGGINRGNRGTMKPGVFGTVSAVSGNTITVSGKSGFGANATTSTFTVDATNAKVMKSGATGTVASIAVGDTIMAQGALTGTNIVATMIRDGVMTRKMPGASGQSGQTPSPIAGNGQPVVAGTVSSVNGETLTITNKSNVSYTIDATNAKIVQGTATVIISSVAVGDNVIVQGTVNGNAIVASSVIDQKPAATTTNASGTTTTASAHKGFFGSIGSFFAHIFGF